MRKRITKVLAAALSLGMAASLACPASVLASDASSVLEGREYSDTYKTYFSRSYSSLNYFATPYATVREIVTNCIDSLVEPDKYGTYVPSLAESWEVNEDYTVWTFKIREGQKWIDYTGAETEYELTAQDFADGIRYIADPLNDAYSMRVIRNLISGLSDYYWALDDIDCGDDTEHDRDEVAAGFDEAVGVKVLDDYTIEYRLEASAPYFLSLVESSMLLLPIEYDYAAGLGDDFGVDNDSSVTKPLPLPETSITGMRKMYF